MRLPQSVSGITGRLFPDPEATRAGTRSFPHKESQPASARHHCALWYFFIKRILLRLEKLPSFDSFFKPLDFQFGLLPYILPTHSRYIFGKHRMEFVFIVQSDQRGRFQEMLWCRKFQRPWSQIFPVAGCLNWHSEYESASSIARNGSSNQHRPSRRALR